MGQMSRAMIGPPKAESIGVFLAGGAVGLLVGITVGVACSRPLASAVQLFRRRRTDVGPQFEYLAQ